jgi:MFS family permease
MFREFTRSQILAIAVAIACITIVGIGLSLSVPLLSFVLAERGISRTMIGLNTAMGGVATILAAPFIPRLAAIVGVRALLAGALVLGAAVFIAFYVVWPFWLWFPLRFLYGVALAVLFVLSEFWINAAAPERSRGLVMGVYATCLSLGFAIGPTILAVVDRGSFAPYAIGAVLFLVALLPVGLAGRVAPELGRHGSGSILVYLRAAPSAIAAGLVFGAVETGAMSFLPLYGLRLGYEAATAALLVTVMAVGNVLIQVPIGVVSDRVDRRKLLLALGIIGTLGAAAMPFVAAQPVALFTLIAVWGGLVAGLYTVGLAHLGARFRGDELAGANATFVMMYSLGLLIGPPLLGFGMDVVDPHGLPVAISLLCGAYVLLVIYRLTRHGRTRPSVRLSENP